METYLRCRVTPGLFSGEVAVRGVAADGNDFSMFVSTDFVKLAGPLRQDRPVTGWLRVEVLSQPGERTLVRLPGQAFETGSTLAVDASQLKQGERK